MSGTTTYMYSNTTLMVSSNTTIDISATSNFIVYDCMKKTSAIFTAILALIGLPINLLLLKILTVNFRLGRPRHKILLSLATSDCLQISLIALIQFPSTKLKTTDIACQVTRKGMEVIAVVTIIGSSGSILALSVERYVACIHCLQAELIASDKRVVRALTGIWCFGIICSLCDDKRYKRNLSYNPLPFTIAFNIMYTTVVISSTAIILYIQVRLYRESHRLMRVAPGTGRRFGSNAEANYVMRKQLKVSFVASVLVMMYVVCMCPLAFYMIGTEFRDTYNIADVRLAVIFLAQLNTFADPFMYGLGMSDTRRELTREIRRIKHHIMEIIGYFPN